MDSKTPLWAVSIQGPDDLIPVASYLNAIKIANAFNVWWQDHIDAHGLQQHAPRMWAIPANWPWSDESHAEGIANPSVEYADFVSSAIGLAEEGER